MRHVCFVVSAILAFVAYGYNVNKRLSFSAPFKDYNYDGSRHIRDWSCTGDAVINEYFVRLTPDRQSKHGMLWNMNTFSSGEFVTTIKFRISGQGANLFGDGFAVFFTKNRSPIPGKMYSLTDVYYGFAIAFSTFQNTEFSRYHRDIAIYVGDGESNAYTQDKDHTGCYARYRFHEKRQDFSVDNYAVVKIGYSAKTGMVRVAIDEKNTGNFRTCFTEVTNFEPGWWREATIGISATTGQLADNHDILSVETVEGEGNPDNVQESKPREISELEESESSAFQEMMKKYSVNVNALGASQRNLLKVMEIADQRHRLGVNKMRRELEHRIVSVDESLNNMIKKLQQSSDISENRIREVEDTLRSQVSSVMNQKLEERVRVVEEAFNQSLKAAVKRSNTAWMIPFALIVIVVVVVMAVVYSKYRTAQKTHLL